MATLRQHCPDCRGLARARSSIDAMKVLAAPSPTPAPTGRLREWNGGVPGHGEFVMLKTQPTDGSVPLEFSSKFGSRLWMSPDDELPPTVSGEACTLRQLIRQGTFPDTGTGECSPLRRARPAPDRHLLMRWCLRAHAGPGLRCVTKRTTIRLILATAAAETITRAQAAAGRLLDASPGCRKIV